MLVTTKSGEHPPLDGVTPKRTVLIVEDNELNREILKTILASEYEVLEACNGEEGLSILSERYQDISLVMLDVYMPVCTGFEVLERAKNDPVLSAIPFIVTTGSDNPEDEIRCLKLGATDFVSKPYSPDVVLARIGSTIRLRESVATLSVVERDSATGLYTLETFYHRAANVLKQNKESYDVAVFALRGASALSQVHSRERIKNLLIQQAEALAEKLPCALLARKESSIYVLLPASRRERVLDPHHRETLFAKESIAQSDLSFAVGYYQDIDANSSMETNCARAFMAAETMMVDRSQQLCLFDEAMESALVRSQHYEASFANALEQREFEVWLQPKVSIVTGKYTGAEALVRWITTEGDVIPPAEFIPLFESDGLISKLDEYVFRAVCKIQNARQQSGDKLLPISINLSRVSLYAEDLIERYRSIAEAENVPLNMVPLEITESAANGNDITLLAVCENLKQAGFLLHMDDYGTGYSSLSILASHLFSTLKLDKRIIDGIGTDGGNIIARNALHLAHELGMKAVAEGVETVAQMEFLKDAGCNCVQGFLYSPPIQASQFIALLNQGGGDGKAASCESRLAD